MGPMTQKTYIGALWGPLRAAYWALLGALGPEDLGVNVGRVPISIADGSKGPNRATLDQNHKGPKVLDFWVPRAPMGPLLLSPLRGGYW